MLCSYFGSVKIMGKDSYIKAPFSHTFASETGKTGIEIVSPILDKRKGKKDSPYGPL